ESDGSDISGDNNEYKTVKKENIGGAKVTLKGKGESVYVATWENGGYSYAMTASPGLKDPTMKALILSVVERS
ncbi:MAG: DUF4367 domain-containing protein, partial [Eubacteriales bacterium]|nr:DUF4367 domain-containing protein [Eubacteriales bacterium]